MKLDIPQTKGMFYCLQFLYIWCSGDIKEFSFAYALLKYNQDELPAKIHILIQLAVDLQCFICHKDHHFYIRLSKWKLPKYQKGALVSIEKRYRFSSTIFA